MRLTTISFWNCWPNREHEVSSYFSRFFTKLFNSTKFRDMSIFVKFFNSKYFLQSHICYTTRWKVSEQYRKSIEAYLRLEYLDQESITLRYKTIENILDNAVPPCNQRFTEGREILESWIPRNHRERASFQLSKYIGAIKYNVSKGQDQSKQNRGRSIDVELKRRNKDLSPEEYDKEKEERFDEW